MSSKEFQVLRKEVTVLPVSECNNVIFCCSIEVVFTRVGSTDLAFKSARIVDLCGKSSGFADFENTVDGGSAANFGADSGLCLF